MILAFPWSRPTTEGKPSPKNYPHWPGVVTSLLEKGYRVHQVSCKDEPGLGCTVRSDDLPLAEIERLLRACLAWVSVDSFVPHMAWTLKEPGVVIFGKSDPEIFGHAENTNLLKDRRFLRIRQFGLWSQEEPYAAAFVGPEVVVAAVLGSIDARRRRAPAPG